MQTMSPRGGALGPLPQPRIIPKRRYVSPVIGSERKFPGQLENERVVAIRRSARLYAIVPSLPMTIGLTGIAVEVNIFFLFFIARHR